MIYTCNLCKFSFERKEQPSRCPDCGKVAVREATASECSDYYRYREEFAAEAAALGLDTIPGAIPVKPVAIPIVKEFKDGKPIFEDKPFISWEPDLRRVVGQ